MNCSARALKLLTKRSVEAWIDDRASSMGAAIAYYTAFSLAPLLLIVTAVGGLAFGKDAARGALLQEIGRFIGSDGARAVQAALAGFHDRPGGLGSAVVGGAVLGLGATTVFTELQADLDRIWKTCAASDGIRIAVRRRLLSFGLVLSLGLLLLISLLLSAALAVAVRYFGPLLPGGAVLLQIFDTGFSLTVVTLIFAALYKLLPNAEVRWDDVWIGAALTSALFVAGKFLIGLYIGRAALASSFGAAGAFLVLLAWIYYSSQIFLLGAEFTHQYARLKRAAPLQQKDKRR